MYRIKLLGFIIWGIPFLASFFLWDPVANGPSISGEWFTAIMWVSLAVGFTIAAMKLFRKETKKSAQKTAFLAGWTWWIQLAALDLIVLVLLLGMDLSMWYSLIVSYLSVPILTIGIGAIVAKR